MSIFTKIFTGVKEFFSHFFKNIADGDEQAAKQIEITAEQAVTLINNIKAYLDSPVGDIVVAVIPGTWDNELKEKGIVFLNKAIAQEAALMECFTLNTPGEQLSCVYSKILALNDESQHNFFWHKLGVLATEVFADGRLTFSDAVLAAEMVYRLIFKKDEPLVAE